MLCIRELTLAGFGLYEQPTRFLFPDGPAVFWGANETGKSTLLWGIVSVWFGLPGSSDPSKVGTARFRSFSHPKEFWGSLVWTNDDRRFRLHRDFETHRVRLVEETDEGTVELYTGEHNPSGRSSAGSSFPVELQSRVGLARMDLFLETFCLSQPFVGDAAIDSELQHLISGSRSVRVDDVLQELFGEVKSLTRATGELGLLRPGTSRPTNQRDDGRIEEIQAELARARLDLELGRRHLEKVNTESEDTEEAEREVEEIRSRIVSRERRLQALRRWTELQHERSNWSESVRRMEGSLEELEKRQQEIVELEARLTRDHAAYRDAGEGTSARLEDLERAALDRERLSRDLSVLETRRQEDEAEANQIRARLEGEFADLRGRRDWIDVRNRLREAVARSANLEADIRTLEQEVERWERDLEATEALDGIVVATCRAHAESVLEALERADRIEAKMIEVRRQMEERGYLEDQNRMALLAENLELEGELKECSTLHREQKAAVVLAADRLEQAEERARMGRDTEPGPEDGAGSDELPIEEVPAEAGSGPAPFLQTLSGRRRPLSAIGLGAALALAGRLSLGWPWIGCLLLGLIAGAGIYWSLRPRVRARGSEHETPGARLRRHLRARTQEGAEEDGGIPLSPEEARKALSDAESELTRIQAREHQIEDRLEAIREELGPYARTTAAELARMEERWKLLDEQIESLTRELADLLEERFGASDESNWRRTPVSETSEHLERLLLLPGGPSPDDLPSLEDLFDWLVRLDDADWQAFESAEAARADAVQEMQSIRLRLQHAKERYADRTEIEELEERLRPFTLETDPKWLLEKQDECAELERRLSRLEERLAENEGARAESDPSEDQAVDAARTALLEVWPSAPIPEEGPVHVWAAEARRALESTGSVRARIGSATEALPGLLRSAGVTTRDELEARLASERAALGETVRAIEALERSELALSDAGNDGSAEDRIARLQRRREADEADQQADESALERAEESLRERLREQASLEGRPLPNLASLEIRIGHLESELEDALLRRDALVQAFRWTEEAVETYRATYRESLGERIDHHFSRLTGSPGRRIELGETFEVRVREPGGRILDPEQLSQGAKDQLLLALRLGVADLLSSSVPLPFLFDDPFVHFDEERQSWLRAGLEGLGRDRQWILFTHRKEMADWADPIFTDVRETEPLAAGVPAERVEAGIGSAGPARPTAPGPRGRKKTSGNGGSQGRLFDLGNTEAESS